jgi:hypothetical protein
MTRDAFEQLVNAWLAEPGRDDLRRQVETAAAADPGVARLVAEWRRFDELMRRGCPAPRGVRWERLKARVLAAVEPGSATADEVFEAALRDLPPVADRIHWPRFHARVMAALTRSEAAAAPRRRLYTRIVAGTATLLAAAAALLLALLPHGTPMASPGGLVRVSLSAPPANGAGIAYVHVSGALPSLAPPERLFVVDPMPNTGPSDAAAGYY